MSRQDNFSVALLGFSAREQRVLRVVFELSSTRCPAFSLAPPALIGHVDLYLVDAEDAEAMRRWGALDKRLPVIMVGRQLPAGQHYGVRRPLIATRLLAALERLVTEQLNYTAALALDSSDEIAVGDRPIRPSASGAERRQVSALVVDDSLPVRVQLDLALRSLASRVDFAETGEQALDLIQDTAYDIIFLDVILPGVDGYHVCKVIKGYERTKKTPVIMLTSNSSPADQVKGKLAGCDTYLIKPVRPTVFREVVEDYLPQLKAAQFASAG